MKKFNYMQDFKNIDFRKNPEKYQVGRGEQGLLMIEPYKSEILPHWRFKTPEIARISSEKIYELYLEYKKSRDFVGMDMARKYIQMGYTRARRYANYKGGRKYDEKGEVKEREINDIKAESALIFKEKWLLIRADEEYLALKAAHQKQYG